MFDTAVRPAPYQIVVADESPLIRGVFQSFSADEIVVRHIVKDRQELLKVLASPHPLDAVLCSDHLSGMYGGVQALIELRTTQLLAPDTAFILMTGDARKSNLMVGVEAKPDSILLKPFKPAILLNKLERTVQARRALAELRLLADLKNWVQLLSTANRMLAEGTPYTTAVARFKAEALNQLGRQDVVNSMYRAMLADSPNSKSALSAYAKHAYQQGKLDEAETILNKLLVLQPTHPVAYDILAAVKLEKDDPIAAQQYLQQAVKHAPNSAQRYRELGHVAVLNGDTVTAQRAYLTAMRPFARETEPNEEDVVNAVRSQVLHGDPISAWQVIGDARTAAPDSLALEIMQRFVEAVLCLDSESFGKTQRRITEGLEMLENIIMPHKDVLQLAAVEASLISALPHRALRLSEELLQARQPVKLHPAQLSWAKKLHKWANNVNEDSVPAGLQRYKKLMA